MQTTLFGPESSPKAKKAPRKPRKKAVPKSDTSIAEETIVSGEKILGVSDYLDYINQILKVASDVKVLGEISSFTNHPKGIFMTLKDKGGEGVLECYINPYTYRGLGIPLEVGMEVKAWGSPGIFKRRSQLSLRVDGVELQGEGTLKKAYEVLKAKLEAEGLFDRKRELPEFISSIGIITSKTGAVIDDFRNNLAKLGIKLYMKDVRVEGAQSSAQVIGAIQYFNVRHPSLDCLVVMRGGGSLEDMQAFNSEAVVTEIFASKIPIIAALGHDRDVPLACLAADKFESTPTAAAVLINNSWGRVFTDVPQLQRHVLHKFALTLHTEKSLLQSLAQQVTGGFNQVFQRYRYLAEKILRGTRQVEHKIHLIKEQSEIILNGAIEGLARRLQYITDTISYTEKLLTAASPERNLKLGYALAYDKEGQLLRSASATHSGDDLEIRLNDGSINTTVK